MKPTNNRLKTVTLWDWFILNLKIGALSFGGSGRIFIYEEVVVLEKKWLNEAEFQQIFTLAQVLPGPNLVNLSVYLGYRLAGIKATILGVAALATPGAILATFIVLLVDFNNFHIASLFQGFSIGSVALFGMFVWRLRRGLRPDGTHPIKFILKLGIILGVMASIYIQVPLDRLLAIVIPLCLLVEFLL